VRHGSRVAGALSLGLLALVAGGAAAAQDAADEVSVTVTGLRSGKGKVLACLTMRAEAFPDCSKDPAARHTTVAARKGAVELDFGAVPQGAYAVSLFHDENGNGKLDTMMKIPREGYGFSRDAKVMFGPPRFAAAAFAVERGAVHQTVKMRYLF
jgi:uncharacterized protein (DUF2141 family)